MPDTLNVVLLTVDSLRADHLSCYGYSHLTSPFMDNVARDGALATACIAPAIPTQPSYTTLLTGQYPTTHNIVAHGGKAQLAPDAPSLAEVFLQNGYATCSVDNLWRQRLWFGRGFEFVIDPSGRHSLQLSVSCDELNHRAIPWLRAHAEEPFFLFMHYWDPHYPYIPPQRYQNLFYNGSNPTDPNRHDLDRWFESPLGMVAMETWLRTPDGPITDPAYVTALYDQEIRHLDDGLRDIVTAIDDLGLAERTLIIIVGDHGENMAEHESFFEHCGLYDSVLRVPMLLRLPGTIPTATRLPRMLQHVDIAPTVLEAAGLAIPPALEGKSFWPYALGHTTGGYDEVVSLECTYEACWSIRTDRYKFILTRDPGMSGRPPRELFDLVDDPDEEHNIVEVAPEIATNLEARLEAWIADRLHVAGRTQDPLREQGISLHGLWQ